MTKPIRLTARLQTVKKKTKEGNPYLAERWAWRMRPFPPDAIVQLIGLGPDGKVEEAFEVPAEVLAGKKFIYRNRTHSENRVGSFLERWRVSLLACDV